MSKVQRLANDPNLHIRQKAWGKWKQSGAVGNMDTVQVTPSSPQAPQVILVQGGKFSQLNLWKIKDDNYPEAKQITRKEDYFRWCRDWSFAEPNTSNDPKEYVYGVACLIQDLAAAGLRIDIKQSQGDLLVGHKTDSRRSIEYTEAGKIAKQVLGVS